VPKSKVVDNKRFTFLNFSQIENFLKSRSQFENNGDERIKYSCRMILSIFET